MKQYGSLYILLLLTLAVACTDDIDIDLPQGEDQVVVEGYIEQGLPPLVIVSRTMPFYGEITTASINESIVGGATVVVSSGEQSDTLIELQSDSLFALLDFMEDSLGISIDADEILTQFGVDPDIFGEISFSIYTTPFVLGEVGATYDLEVILPEGGEKLTATTTIPAPLPLDSVWTTPHPDPLKDSLVQLWVRFTDVAGQRNYIRYFTQRNLEPFYPGYFNSVFDDQSLVELEGQSFSFALERGYNRNTQIDDFENYNYFMKEDTIRVRWCSIDREHHAFWSTLEFNRGQTGNPFGRPSTITSNINGGIGIWGGYGASYHVVMPE